MLAAMSSLSGDSTEPLISPTRRVWRNQVNARRSGRRGRKPLEVQFLSPALLAYYKPIKICLGPIPKRIGPYIVGSTGGASASTASARLRTITAITLATIITAPAT